MTRKPTYEELGQRVKALEAEVKKKDRFIRESRDAMYHMDLQSNEIVFHNEFFKNLFAGTDGKVTKKSIALTMARSMSPEEINVVKRKASASLEPGKGGGEVDYQLKFPDGTYHWLHDRWKILHDDNGNPVALEGIIRDITEIKQLEVELRQAQKMEAIGTLAGGIAHEFNNILGIIIGNTELAIDDVPDWNPAKECLEEIRAASLRAFSSCR